jgi:leucyl aminopeptidase
MLDVAFSKPVPPKAGAVALLLAEEEALTGAAAALNEASGGAIARAIEVASFKGQKGKTVLLFAPVEGLSRLLVVGLGKRAELTTLTLEEAGGAIAAALSQEAQVTILAEALAAPEAAHLGLGAILRAYRFDLYRTKEKPEDKPKLTGIGVQTEDPAKAKAAFAPLRAVAEGIFLARDLITEPPNVLTPTEMAERCRALTKLGVKVEIMGPKELEKLGFGALLGVSQGSVQEPRMVVMQWNGAGGRKPRKPLVFVGKGVTFDTGGISIKPAGGMEDM